MTLEEYAKQHPQEESEAERREMLELARSYRAEAADLEKIAQQKAVIMDALKTGKEPQLVLYLAVGAIGLATRDSEWTQQAQRILDGIYSDLAQQSFLVDNEAEAARRLEGLAAVERERTAKQIKARLNAHSRIERALQEVLNAVEALDELKTE